MSRRLTLLTYRNVLNTVDDVLKQSSRRELCSNQELRKIVALCCPGSKEGLKAIDGGNAANWRSFVQSQFRMHSKYTNQEDIAFQLDIGLSAIRYGRMRAAHLMKGDWEQKDPSVRYSVGDVFLHKKWGYTAVICGWDTMCRQSPEWQRLNRIDALEQQNRQPFFHCLVNAPDCGAKDQTITYVAQENIILKAGPADQPCPTAASKQADDKMVANLPPVLHPEIEQFFTAYCPATNKYVPRDSVREKYPED